AEMNLAVQASETDRGIGRLNELLGHWRPAPGEADLRGWEWYYLRGVGQQALLSWPHRHGQDRGVEAVSWSPGGRRLATGGSDGTIKSGDGDAGQETATLRGHGSEVISLSWSPDSRRLASCSADGILKIWDADAGQETATLRGHGGPASRVCWSPDG